MADAPFIPPKVVTKIKSLGISEKDVLDVWNDGESFKLPSGMAAMKKKYVGWGEIGLSYNRRFNGEYILTSVWVRDRV
jgi:hypothetical protein